MLAKRPRTVATPKGHALDYDEWGELIGAVLLNARFQLE
jgi:YD repeat-containing protein